jgi:hypothetical protein
LKALLKPSKKKPRSSSSKGGADLDASNLRDLIDVFSNDSGSTSKDGSADEETGRAAAEDLSESGPVFGYMRHLCFLLMCSCSLTAAANFL